MIESILQNVSFGYCLLALIVLYLISLRIQTFQSNREIARLGYRAPPIKTYFPFGWDLTYRSLTANLSNRSLEFLRSTYHESGVDAEGLGTYTAEVTVSGNLRIIFTSDPDNVKAILTGQFADFGKGERFHEDWKSFMGDGIFATDGDKWQFARMLLRPMFARERVADLDTFEHHLQKLLPMLGTGDGAEVEVSECFFRFTLDAITDFLLGNPVGALDVEDNEFARWFGNIQHSQSVRNRLGPLRRFIPDWARTSYRRDLASMEAFIAPIIDRALKLSTEELDQKLTKSETFLHQLARATKDRTVIRDQIVAILLAGRDTTAVTLSWTFYELARHPAAFAKLRKEIIAQLGPNGRRPNYNDIKDMRYLTWVINETLRHYPAVPYNVRASLKDTTLPRGGGPDGTLPVGVRAGTPVTYSPLLMQRRADLYPPVSESFPYHPDKWEPDRWSTWTPKPWTFIPFNGGPRICLGQQFAMVESGYTICRILQHFDRIVDLGTKDQAVLKADIILSPAEGIRLGFIKSR